MTCGSAKRYKFGPSTKGLAGVSAIEYSGHTLLAEALELRTEQL